MESTSGATCNKSVDFAMRVSLISFAVHRQRPDIGLTATLVCSNWRVTRRRIRRGHVTRRRRRACAPNNKSRHLIASASIECQGAYCASSVGKSSLLLRFTDETFLSPDETSATIGVDFKVKVIERRNKRWKLSIWDTAGQERFRTLTSSYYRGAQGVILASLMISSFQTVCTKLRAVYDITARDTFESLTSWIAELDTFAGTGSGAKEVVRMIVGNKTDREFSRVVSTAEGAAFAKAQNPPWLFMECSAKKGGEDVTGEDGLFSRVVDKIVETPSLYMKTSVGINSINKKGPPGQFPSGTVALDDAEESGGGWCAC
ncbi:BQ2448_561 [Microbotryum intermedium]|uniref:BQ2448_561 protein n=1 Tax=Microbotryum intermedium TaxID=269621 RepID=A0A238F2T0_9BASI|nr:BQ2448_561 [Microbotryum intermedium]